ncbi:hypothetical protein [Brytella acorum]|uniref:Uncharacterized protein n=1 Tax=Brytella acorum TaxID=2959299 RepID=A0AA35UTP5_9PROT|nr:hypothetical protein [Brytella acorum]CAI9119544.1 hypothetical protein LMG32879_000361 [Brytella acorum]
MRHERPRVIGLSQEEIGDLEAKDDETAECETGALSTGKSAAQLKKEARASRHNRNEKLRATFDKLLICGIWFSAGTFTTTTTVWVLNLILPDSWRWLTTEEMSKLQWFVTAGIVASTALPRLKRALD